MGKEERNTPRTWASLSGWTATAAAAAIRFVVVMVVNLGVFAIGAIHAQLPCHPIFASLFPFLSIRGRLCVLDRILKGIFDA